MDRVLAEREGHEIPSLSEGGLPAPPLKRAILAVLDEDPSVVWERDDLFEELMKRGWGPGGANPRNTFTSRLRDLELAELLARVGRDYFTSLKNEEVPAL